MIGLALCLGRPAAEAGRQDEMEEVLKAIKEFLAGGLK